MCWTLAVFVDRTVCVAHVDNVVIGQQCAPQRGKVGQGWKGAKLTEAKVRNAEITQQQRNLIERRARKAATSWSRRSKRRHGGCRRDGPH